MAPPECRRFRGSLRPFKRRYYVIQSSAPSPAPRGAVSSVVCCIIARLVTTVPPPLNPARRR
nr:MAG TPA: hypothetical protein [Caudoviricetes sp.]